MLDIEALKLPLSSASITDGLRGLSKMEIPGEMIRMHKAGRTYSVIDVVVTSGNLLDSIEPTISETHETTREAQSVANVTPERSAQRNATLKAPPVEPSSVFSGKSSSGPTYVRQNQTYHRRAARGYVLTVEPPQQTVEQQFRAIQAAAESPTKTPAEGRGNTQRSRLTRSKTPALATNDVSPAPKQTI